MANSEKQSGQKTRCRLPAYFLIGQTLVIAREKILFLYENSEGQKYVRTDVSYRVAYLNLLFPIGVK